MSIGRTKIFYGWFIVAISLVVMTAAYGVYFSWPVFYVPILDRFGWNRAETALIFSVGSMVYTLASPTAGFLFDKFGPRKLFAVSAMLIALGAVGSSQASQIWQFSLFFGVMVAFGACSAGFVPNLALVSNWFERKRGLAVGISQMGTRDSFLLTPLIQMSIIALGYQNSYLILAAATAVIIIPLSMFLRARPQEMGLRPDGDSPSDEKDDESPPRMRTIVMDQRWVSIDWTLPRAIKTFRFWAFFVLLLGAGFSFTALLNHFVALITDIGFSAMFAANLLLIYAVTAMLGRAGGFLADVIGREQTFTLSMILMLLPLPVLVLVKDTASPWLFYLFIICFGFGSGLYTPAYAAGAADLFSGRQFGTIIGSANMGYGLGASIGTWLYGYIYDITGNYNSAIIVVMVAVLVKLACMWAAAPRKVRRVTGRTTDVQ